MAAAPENEVSRGGGFAVAPGTGKRPGVLVTMPFDRDLIARFRATFPTAKWRRALRRWFVPGTTAEQRVDAWIAREFATLDSHADDKGRDAYAFEPLASRYLETPPESLVVRTPYSRRVVDLLRGIASAHWDPAIRAWRVPWRGYEDLRAVWPAIEAAAAEAEPAARRARAAARDPNRESERRRRRHPVPQADPPPLGAPVETREHGVVTFEALDADPLDPAAVATTYRFLGERGGSFVWGWWRMPTFAELAAVLPAAGPDDPARGWWPPTRDGLDERRRRLRETAHARETRAARRAAREAAPDPA
ncbi:hypothetical protein [uncultured Methylobacterium sp.]|uniref:hypothetical protein n=1 Tax=uncultured Methylobacterium sp. TaxID=157278 RepID=UPI0026066E46|nr:hypothetical protein [uncultured Methylobacterium sp.]